MAANRRRLDSETTRSGLGFAGLLNEWFVPLFSRSQQCTAKLKQHISDFVFYCFFWFCLCFFFFLLSYFFLKSTVSFISFIKFISHICYRSISFRFVFLSFWFSVFQFFQKLLFKKWLPLWFCFLILSEYVCVFEGFWFWVIFFCSFFCWFVGLVCFVVVFSVNFFASLCLFRFFFLSLSFLVCSVLSFKQQLCITHMECYVILEAINWYEIHFWRPALQTRLTTRMKKCLDLSSFSLSSPTFVMNVFSISTGTMLMTLTSDATESSCTIGGILASVFLKAISPPHTHTHWLQFLCGVRVPTVSAFWMARLTSHGLMKSRVAVTHETEERAGWSIGSTIRRRVETRSQVTRPTLPCWMKR